MNRILYFLIVLMASPLIILSQVDSISRDMEEETMEQLETLPIDNDNDNTDLSVQDERIIYEVEDLRRLKINFNEATEDDFSKIPFLTGLQIQNIINYRKNVGPIISKYELQSIPDINPYTAKLLSLIFSFDENSKSNEYHGQIVVFLSTDYPTPAGYNNGNYSGNNFKNTNRIRVFNRSNSFAICTENDPGEPFQFTNKQCGMDHIVGFYRHQFQHGSLKNITLGNYSVQLAQGLSMWQRFAMNRAGGSVFIRRQSEVISPFASAREYNYFRGVALSFEKKKFQWQLWGSYRFLDATIQYDTTEFSYIENFNSTGLHRTSSEMMSRMGVGELHVGLNLYYTHGDRLRLGIYSHLSHYNPPLYVPDVNYYNFYRFQGDNMNYTGLYAYYTVKNWNSFAELTFLNMNKIAFNWGNVLSLNRYIDVATYVLYQDKDYQSFYGNAFLQTNTTPHNAIYFGFDLFPKYKTKVSLFVNYLDYSQMRYLLPDYTNEWQRGINIQKIFSKTAQLSLKYSNRIYPRYNGDLTYKTYDDYEQHQFKLSIRKIFSKRLEWANNVYYSHLLDHTTGVKSDGYAITQDIEWVITQGLSIKWRLAYFQNDNFYNRIYTFEPNVPYQYSFRFFNGQGFQSILNVRQKITKKASIYFRYFVEKQPSKNTLGSGNELIHSNTAQMFSFQFQYTF